MTDEHWKRILSDNPIGTVETYWVELGLSDDDDDDVAVRARAGGIKTETTRHGRVFRSPIPVLQKEGLDQQHADEIFETIEWLLSGATSLTPRPDAAFRNLKLLTSVPEDFEGETDPGSGAELVEASVYSQFPWHDTVRDLFLLYVKQISKNRKAALLSPEEILACIKNHWALGDVGAAEKCSLGQLTNEIDWVAEAERMD